MDSTSKPTTVNDLILAVLHDARLSAEEKRVLIDEIRKNNPGTADRWTYRWAIYILGGVAAMTVIGLILIASWNLTAPDGLVAIGSASIGGLAGWRGCSRQVCRSRRRRPQIWS